MKKKIVSLLACVFLLTACDSNKYETINSNVAMDLIENNNAIIIDVRTKDEYEKGHIKDSVNNPIEIISDAGGTKEVFNIDYDKETVIIVYCASGVRSSKAAQILIDRGYTNVYNLDGGLINWGFELVTE